MNSRIFPKMAFQNIKRGKQIYLPYLLTIIGTVAGFYITAALSNDPGITNMRGSMYVATMLRLGSDIIGFFSAIFLIYTNSFLIKRRKRELGLYAVLGMGKKHISLMLTLETIYISVLGIIAGIAAGMLFYKLALLLLFKILSFPVPFGFHISTKAISITVALFGAIMAVTLLNNMMSVWRMNTVQLLHDSSTGEKEPKTKLLLTLAGVVSLGAGYYIAMTVGSAIEALAYYFLAVFLVIIGTYCLFTSITIAVMKALRKNKNYYYKSGHFISLSGMLYRMKRNAVGLANICILSTMVLVMISGTLSLYLGTEDALNIRYRGDITALVQYDMNQGDFFDGDKAAELLVSAAEEKGYPVKSIEQCIYLPVGCIYDGNGDFTVDKINYSSGNGTTVCFTSCDQLQGSTEKPYEKLAAGKVYYSSRKKMPDAIKISFGEDKQYAWEAEELPGGMSVGELAGNISDVCYIVLPDDNALADIYKTQKAYFGETASDMRWEALMDIDADDAGQKQCSTMLSEISFGQQVGAWERYSVESRAANAEDIYALNGGFFFLGILLGIIFVMGTVLIIYYKQISEGYDDRERFQIMQKVGLSRKEVKRSISAQILVVFFMPLLIAAVHVIFDFKIMTVLLRLFFINNNPLVMVCTAATFMAFAIIYAIVYSLTAKSYYKIVS
ncbi:MAG: ABC transporter permease [Clostridiaceae bacterium]|nr:ABC transporter permease [Clostridiaceae bacterium]